MKTWPTWISIVVAAAALVGLLAYGNRAPLAAHQIIGVVVAIPAFCLWVLARVQLRTSFAVSAQAKELVTHGLYSKIQNPVYVFGAILIAGLIVYVDQPRFFSVVPGSGSPAMGPHPQ